MLSRPAVGANAIRQTSVPQVGFLAPPFALTELTGQTVHLSDYQGRVVLLNFWAYWCPPCRAEIPDLNAYYLAHQGDGFVLLGINAGESTSVVAAFAH